MDNLSHKRGHVVRVMVLPVLVLIMLFILLGESLFLCSCCAQQVLSFLNVLFYSWLVVVVAPTHAMLRKLMANYTGNYMFINVFNGSLYGH